MRLLLVDDDADDHSFFFEALRRIDRQIVCEVAINGEDALHKLGNAQQLPDAIFMDINMPVLSGHECFDRLKSDRRLRNIPVVMLSTSRDPFDIGKFESRGASYMIKSPELNTLVNLLRTYVTRLKSAIMLLTHL